MRTQMTITFATEDQGLVEFLKAVLEVLRRRDGVMMRVRELQEDATPPQGIEGVTDGTAEDITS